MKCVNRLIPIKSIVQLSLILVTCLLSGCKNDEEPAPPEFKIVAVDPPSGTEGDRIRVAGYGFIESLEGNTVTFNGKEVEIVLAKPTRIEVIIPLGLGTGPVSVTNINGTITGPLDFIYIPKAVVSTIAGNGTAGFKNGTGTAATFRAPSGLEFDKQDNLYVFDVGNHVIRKITPDGVVSTFAGNGSSGTSNGSRLSASFIYPMDGGFDGLGNLFVADGAGAIRVIKTDGNVSTVAGLYAPGFTDGSTSVATFNYPHDVEVIFNGDVFVADSENNSIRKISAGVVTTFAGSGLAGIDDGVGIDARFEFLEHLAQGLGSTLYATQAGGIRKITAAKETTTLYKAPFNQKIQFNGVALNSKGTVFYTLGSSVSMINKDGESESIVGGIGFQDGIGDQARFGTLSDIAINSNGEIYLADKDNHAIRKIVYK